MARSRAVLAAALVLSIVSLPPAGAQSEREVARAAGRAEAAARERAAAESGLAAASQRLWQAHDEYQAVTAELRTATVRLAELHESARSAEVALRERRNVTRTRVLEAYAGAAEAANPALVFSGTTMTDALMADELIRRTVAARVAAIPDLSGTREAMHAARGSLEDEQSRAAELRRRAASLITELEDLTEAAAVEVERATRVEVTARSAHDQAVLELEAAKRSVSPGALAWRDLVLAYFPESLQWEALQVLDCESRGNPAAVNATSDATGLFQFLEGTWLLASTFAGFPGADRTDPEANVAAAAWLVEHSIAVDHSRGRWGHWVCQPVDRGAPEAETATSG